MKEIKTVFYYVMLSITAILLIIIMVLFKPFYSYTITIYDRLSVAAIFFAICIFGISIAIYPNWWRKKIRDIDNNSNLFKEKKSRIFNGHHPDCNKFRTHIIINKNKTRCAGCLGLIIGALISIFLITLYLFIPFRFPIITYYFLLTIGILLLIFVYIEILLIKRHTFVHITLNSLLILSFLMITISIIEITKNLIFSFLTIILCLLWLDTRIIISKYQHQRICNYCSKFCKSY